MEIKVEEGLVVSETSFLGFHVHLLPVSSPGHPSVPNLCSGFFFIRRAVTLN